MLLSLLLLVISALFQEPIDQPLAVFETNATIHQIQWHPDGSVLAVSSNDGVMLYTDSLEPVAHIHDSETICSIAWSPAGDQLALTYNSTVQIWQWDADELALTLAARLQGANTQLVVLWSANKIITFGAFDNIGFWIGHFHVWDASTRDLEFMSDYYTFPGSLIATQIYALHPDQPMQIVGLGNAAERRANGRYYAITDFILYVLDLETKQRTVEIEGNSSISIAWQPSGYQAAVGNQGGVSLYDAATRELVHSFATYTFTYNTDWTTDGRYLAGDVTIMDVESSQVIGSFLQNTIIQSIDWHPDDHRLAIADTYGTIRIEDARLLPGFAD